VLEDWLVFTGAREPGAREPGAREPGAGTPGKPAPTEQPEDSALLSSTAD